MKPLSRRCPRGGKHDLYKARFGIGSMTNGKITVIGKLPGRRVWACHKCGRAWGKPPKKMTGKQKTFPQVKE